MSDYTALRAALAAGPTSGPWVACGPSFGDPLPRWLDCVVQPDDEDGGITIARADDGFAGCGSADMAYIAAADPATIAALLAELDDARRDAERYRWLRAQCNSVTNLVQYRHRGCHYTIACNSSIDMDAAIDTGIAERATMKGKP